MVPHDLTAQLGRRFLRYPEPGWLPSRSRCGLHSDVTLAGHLSLGHCHLAPGLNDTTFAGTPDRLKQTQGFGTTFCLLGLSVVS